MIKTYLIVALLVGLGAFGAFYYVSGLKSEIREGAEVIVKLNSNLKVLEGANAANQKTIKELQADVKAGEDAYKALELVKQKEKIVVTERLVTVEKLVNQDPVLNTRKLSPVLEVTIAAIQAARKDGAK